MNAAMRGKLLATPHNNRSDALDERPFLLSSPQTKTRHL